MRSKSILPKILIISGFILLFLIIQFRGSIQDFSSNIFDSVKINLDNFFYQSEAKRHAPVTLVQKETELRLYIGEPFRSFTPREWKKFWLLIYGAFPKDKPERAGLPRKIRQLTEDEIAQELISLYPEPFVYFQDQHWNMFFEIILKK